MNIDDIVFGNPSSRDYGIMRRESFLDSLLPKLYRFTPPKNSSAPTRSELETIVNLLSKSRKNTDNLFDEQLLDLIKQVFVDAGCDKEFIDTVAGGVADDVIPLVTKMKYYFNRPRPGQLAHYYDLPLYPDHSYFTNNPSYPSGHVTLTFVTCHVLGNHFPDTYNKVNNIITNVKDSRLYLGVHYPSDNDMAVITGKAIMEHPEFKLKYQL